MIRHETAVMAVGDLDRYYKALDTVSGGVVFRVGRCCVEIKVIAGPDALSRPENQRNQRHHSGPVDEHVQRAGH